MGSLDVTSGLSQEMYCYFSQNVKKEFQQKFRKIPQFTSLIALINDLQPATKQS